jgi:DNA repair exonuclease SbcCD ATPase subunit
MNLRRFISATKGRSICTSSLLGLSPLRRQLRTSRSVTAIEKVGGLQALRQKLSEHAAAGLEVLPDVSLTAAEEALAPLATRYVGGKQIHEFLDLVGEIETAIGQRITLAEPDQRRHFALQQIEAEEIGEKLQASRRWDRKTAALAAGLNEQIAVLEEAANFVEAVEGGPESVCCPACGRAISVRSLASHVQGELARLERAREVEGVPARRALSSSVSRVLRIAEGPDLEGGWRASPGSAEFGIDHPWPARPALNC